MATYGISYLDQLTKTKNTITKNELSQNYMHMLDLCIKILDEYRDSGTYLGKQLQNGTTELRDNMFSPFGILNEVKTLRKSYDTAMESDVVLRDRQVESVQRVIDDALKIREASASYVSRNIEYLTGRGLQEASQIRTIIPWKKTTEWDANIVVDAFTGEIIYAHYSDENEAPPTPQSTVVLSAKFSEQDNRLRSIYHMNQQIKDDRSLLYDCHETLLRTMESVSVIK